LGIKASHVPFARERKSRLEECSDLLKRFATMALVRYLGQSLLATLLVKPVFAQYTPQEIAINSGRPTFYDPSTSIPGKIALEEHVGNDLLTGLYTTPYYPNTNEPQWSDSVYLTDLAGKMTNISSRIANMNAANISISVLAFGGPGIQGIFNATYATYAAAYVNDYLSTNYKNNGNYSGRFEFWCK
jgi:2,3-dihydroxybenzoate decarboxylase